MNRNVGFLFAVFSLFLFPFFIFASSVVPIAFTEIMYNLKTGSDSGREWVEIENTGNNSVDVSGFRLFDSEKGVLKKHAAFKIFRGSAILPPQGFAVIAEDPKKFLIDWPDYLGVLFSSSFSLSNTGETIAIADKSGNEIDRVNFISTQGGAGNGKSLQKNGSLWQEGLPTPGMASSALAFVSAPESVPQSVVVAKTENVKTQKAVTIEENSETLSPDFAQVSPDEPATVSQTAAISFSQKNDSDYLWIFALVGFILVAIFGFLFVSKKKVTQNEFTIVE